MASRVRNKEAPHRNCRPACTETGITLRAVTIDGPVRILTYTCAVCGEVWQVPQTKHVIVVERSEVRF